MCHYRFSPLERNAEGKKSTSHINVAIFILEFIRSVVNFEFTERIDSLISVSDNKQRTEDDGGGQVAYRGE